MESNSDGADNGKARLSSDGFASTWSGSGMFCTTITGILAARSLRSASVRPAASSETVLAGGVTDPPPPKVVCHPLFV